LGSILKERERLVNRCYTRLETPFAPEVLSVMLEDGERPVLVIRIFGEDVDVPRHRSISGKKQRLNLIPSSRIARLKSSPRLAASWAPVGG
jgi:hypothetical protein